MLCESETESIRLSEQAWNRNRNQDIAGIMHHWCQHRVHSPTWKVYSLGPGGGPMSVERSARYECYVGRKSLNKSKQKIRAEKVLQTPPSTCIIPTSGLNQSDCNLISVLTKS